MEVRALGGSGIQVGAIGLGCMGMSHAYDVSTADDATSTAVIRRALELGVTLIDTADVYGSWRKARRSSRFPARSASHAWRRTRPQPI